jgi:hypothetical protein
MQSNNTIRTPAVSALDLTCLCSVYVLAKFQSELAWHSSQPISITMAPRPTLPLPPLLLPVPVIVELDGIADMLADAYLNRGG